ncbi:MAG: FHA domain-containing protein [Actinomycetaceae bacterium]|nr:FHA domain-containing protein [Actinomycetaceae bacterium]
MMPEHDPSATAVFQKISLDEPQVPNVALKPEALAAVQELPPNSALLIVQRGPNSGARFLLDSERTTSGRHPSSDIFLDDVTVSRKHAEFFALESGGYGVRDAGSLNGTYVNRERVEKCALRAGDEVQIGKYRMTYHPSPRMGEA